MKRDTLTAAILDVDLGNSRLKWRLRDADNVSRGAIPRAEFVGCRALMDELQRLLRGARPEHVRVSCVAEQAFAAALAEWCQENWGCEAEFACVTRESSGVQVGYTDPQRLGVDRWLGVLAATRLGADGVVVVDCGTAVTIDILSGHRHLGGYIVPGLRLMNEALFSRTANGGVAQFQTAPRGPGRDTRAAVHAGLQLMLTGLVNQVLLDLKAEGWWHSNFDGRLVLTGGDAALLQELLGNESIPVNVEPVIIEELVMDGLELSARRHWPHGDVSD